MKVPAKLSKVLSKHLPVESSSSRSIQRVAALYLGSTNPKIENATLRELCEVIGLFDYEGVTGKNTFGANFTVNMKKDSTAQRMTESGESISYRSGGVGALWSGDHKAGWKLSAAGKAEAKRIFEDGEAPTRRRGGGGEGKAKKKATKAKKKPAKKKATKTKKKATKTKKKAAKKAGGKSPAASSTASSADRVKRKSALAKKKKRNLTAEKKAREAKAVATTAETPVAATAGASTDKRGPGPW